MPQAMFSTAVLVAIIPVFLVMGMGFLFRMRRWMPESLEPGFMGLILNLLAPCLIFTNVARNPALSIPGTAGWTIFLGAAFILAGFAVSYLVGRLIGLSRGHGLRTFTVSAGVHNYGFVALPVIAALFPGESGPFGLVFLHGLGVELAMWTVGLLIFGSGQSPWRMLINGPCLAVLFSLLANFTGLGFHVPGVVFKALEMLGQCSIPMSLFIIGATIAGLCDRDILHEAWRSSIGGCIARLGLIPLVMLAAAKWLPLSMDLRKLIVVEAGMPAALMPIMLARIYGGRAATAAQVVIATTVVGLLSSPVVIGFGLKWLGIAGKL